MNIAPRGVGFACVISICAAIWLNAAAQADNIRETDGTTVTLTPMQIAVATQQCLFTAVEHSNEIQRLPNSKWAWFKSGG
jgi:hypothetical protein